MLTQINTMFSVGMLIQNSTMFPNATDDGNAHIKIVPCSPMRPEMGMLMQNSTMFSVETLTQNSTVFPRGDAHTNQYYVLRGDAHTN